MIILGLKIFKRKDVDVHVSLVPGNERRKKKIKPGTLGDDALTANYYIYGFLAN